MQPADPIRGVVAVNARDRQLLVIRRSQSVVAPGAYCFPGGAIAVGEDEPTAIVREMREELHVAVHPLRLLWRSVTPWAVPLAWWLVEMPADAELRPHPSEVESVHWMTPEELEELPDLLESNRHFLAAWRRGEFRLELGECTT